MKWRHWSILIVLVLLNYIIFSTALNQLARQQRPTERPTRTPWPTFERIEATPIAWIVRPTSTPQPTRPIVTPSPTAAPIVEEPTAPVEPSAENTSTEPTPAPTNSPPPTPSPLPPTATATGDLVVHTVQRGETLSEIAKQYGVSVQAIVAVNGLDNPNLIITGQKLIIPAPGEEMPTTTRAPQPTKTSRPAAGQSPTATLTPKPTPTATSSTGSLQFIGQVIWDPVIAPNCSGPAISKQSMVKDAAGNPVNGVRIEVECYGNKFLSHPTGNPGEYEPGHYDFSFGQSTPQNWTCTARVVEVNGQPVTSSQVVTIQFDTNNCRPEGSGHQVAIVHWTKHW